MFVIYILNYEDEINGLIFLTCEIYERLYN